MPGTLVTRLAAAALLALFVSCGATKLAYLPQVGGSVADALTLVERVVHEQPSDHTASHFELTGDYLERSRCVRISGSRGPSQTLIDRVHFDGITALDVFQDGDVFFVRIRHNGGGFELNIYTNNLQRAHEFADALARLQSWASSGRVKSKLMQ